MNYSIRKWIICVALVIGCVCPVATQAQVHLGQGLSAIGGQVQGFIQFHRWNVLVASGSGAVVADLLTAPDGTFQISVKPGKYVLRAYTHNVGPYPLLRGTPVEATVGQDEFVRVSLPITAPPL